ncbi:hypothetical protein [Rosenbergiella nectarea]
MAISRVKCCASASIIGVDFNTIFLHLNTRAPSSNV